ncbi:MAG TPA: hypothetical protein VFF65_13490, partial [Phycisphaerales bacterium]|nr:hypothetical protein [Phycisphaerales bacterium]
WTVVTRSLPFAPRGECAVVVFDGGSGEKMWVMGGLWAKSDHERELYNDVWSSADGVNWTQVQTSNVWPARAWHRALVFQKKMWVIGGGISVGAPPYWGNDVWSSSDGASWTRVTAGAQWGPRFEFGAAVFNPASAPSVNQMWICGGSDVNNQQLAESWHTEDGATWTKSSAPWRARDRGNLLMLNDKLYLLGGVSDHDVLTDMWAMDANRNWSELPDRMPYQESDLGSWSITSGVFKWRAWLSIYTPERPLFCYNP